MPTFTYKKIRSQQDFVDRKSNTPSTPRKDRYYVGETEDVTGVSMISPIGKEVSVGDFHKNKGAIEGGMGWRVVNKGPRQSGSSRKY